MAEEIFKGRWNSANAFKASFPVKSVNISLTTEVIYPSSSSVGVGEYLLGQQGRSVYLGNDGLIYHIDSPSVFDFDVLWRDFLRTAVVQLLN